MIFLFCDNLDSTAQGPGAEMFLKQKAPENLLRERREAEKELDLIVKKRRHVLLVFAIITRFIFFAGWGVLGAIVGSDFPMKELYRLAPWEFWLCGGLLLISGIFALVIRTHNRNIYNREDVQSVQNRADSAENAICEYLNVPYDVEIADILTFSYRNNSGELAFSGSASNREVYFYKHDQTICIYDRNSVFAFPQDELTGIRVLRQGIPVANWNKSVPSSTKWFKENGVIPYQNSLKGLRFFCALEIFHAGELCSLLFPAYELPVIRELTGLPAPDLPDTSITGMVRQNNQEEQWPREKERIRPQFYWLPPKGVVKFWFTPQSDAEFQTKHPVLFYVLITAGIIVVFLPAVLFCYLALRKTGLGFPEMLNAEFKGGYLLVFFGGMIMGFGLFNIAAAWVHQYLGHIMTILFILIGAILIGAGAAII